ncbi:HpcH/HpaI aldolase/citrate lyase family protein, partial [Mycobacterium sp. NPDC003449]
SAPPNTAGAPPARTPGCQWWVRLDPARLEEGVRAAARPGTTGVFVPGAELELLRRVDALLTDAERADTGAPLAVIAQLETARGMADVRDIARAPRLHRLGLGEADLAAELGMSPSPDRHELWHLRGDVVLASALAGLVPPVGPVQTELGDGGLLARSTVQLVRQGFSARTLIHPDQVAVVHEALAPTPEELADARDVLAVFDDAQANGSGVARDRRGRMVDLAVVRSARAITARGQA